MTPIFYFELLCSQLWLLWSESCFLDATSKIWVRTLWLFFWYTLFHSFLTLWSLLVVPLFLDLFRAIMLKFLCFWLQVILIRCLLFRKFQLPKFLIMVPYPLEGLLTSHYHGRKGQRLLIINVKRNWRNSSSLVW